MTTSKRARCAPHEQRRWGDPQPRQQEPLLFRTKDHLRSRCWETGRRGRLPNQRRGLPRWVCVICCGRPSGQGSGSAALGQSLACQPLTFRWKVGDLRALRLAALAVLGRVLVPGPAVATPALAGVHLLGHRAPLSQALLTVCVYPASGDAHIPAARTGPRLDNDDRGPDTVGCGTGLLAAHAGWSSADDGVLPRHRRSTGCYRAGGPPLPGGSGAGWYVLDADVGEPGRNHNGVPVGTARVALGMIAVRPPGRPPHRAKPKGAGDVDGVADREDRTGQTVGLGG
jgi:hypothetical protein